MKKIYMLILALLVLYSIAFCSNTEIKAINNNNIIYYSANYEVDFTNSKLLEIFDYAFVGKVESKIYTSQYDGKGMQIPYTYFEVSVIEERKGNLEETIKIKFYGGYDDVGNLHLFDEMEYPEINSYYKFYCNKSSANIINDSRTLEGSYIISTPYNMEKIEYKNFDSSLSNNKSRILDGLIDPEMGQYEPGGGGEVISNISFDSASSLTLGTEKHLYLGPGITRYYKYTPTTLNYLSIYSSGTLDSIITIYDETYNVILSNDTVYGHGLGYTTSPNFFCNFYAEKNKTYFFEVEQFSSTDNGYIDMLLFVDNWSYSNYSDLVINVDDVDNKRKVEYKNNSKYSSEIDYAISEWNKLESILITPDTSSTLNNVVINDYYDASGSYILGYTVHNWIFSATIYLNTYYLDTVSQAERIHTILHEFGHVLGLGEFTSYESSNNVMHQGCLSLTHLGPADIGAYRYLWG